MRNISFSLTTPQIRARTKTVTRRVGRFWTRLRIGEVLCACEKTQGIKKGGIVRLCEIRVVDVGVEDLRVLHNFPSYGAKEVVAEGFPRLTPMEFIVMFVQHMPKVTKDWQVTRIEFEYVEAPSGAGGEGT